MSSWKKGKELNNGQYIIESIVLKGSSGFVYRAKDNQTGNLISIRLVKNIWQNQPNSQEKKDQVFKELLKLANCHHPNLVKLYPDLYQEDNQWYVVMDYADGEDLATYLDRKGKLTENQALNVISKIASGLNLLHQNNFFHQEIRPQNIILRRGNLEPILFDLGTAIELFKFQKERSSQNLTDYFTPIEKYQPPFTVGPYTDIYGLASTLYVLVTGQFPTACNHRGYKELISPQQYNPKLSDTFTQGIIQGLEVKPKSRPQSVKEWFKLLQSSNSNKSNSSSSNLDSSQSVSSTQSVLATENKNKPTTTEVKLIPFEFETISLEAKPFIGFLIRVTTTSNNHTGKCFIEDLGNNVLLEMVSIPAGNFMMGSNNNELERGKDENPQHRVKIMSFYMSKYPITQAQWKAVAQLKQVNRSLESNPSFFKGDDLPVEKVSWYDAVEFCDRLSQYTGKKYRLPSEAQWEYACRGGTNTPFFCGDIITTDVANYDGRKGYGIKGSGKYLKKTTPVTTFCANPFGLYDVHGNVWEWCQDHYAPNYQGKPTDGSAYRSMMSNQPRVVRGGSWSLTPDYCRSAKRSSYTPESSYNFVGFRVICI